MGWSSGSGIMDEIISVVYESGIDLEKRKIIYARLIEVFAEQDCDTMDECLGIDKAFDLMYNEAYETEEEEDEGYDE